MTRLAVQPQPCVDPDCRGQHSPDERIALAASLCGERGVRLTRRRRQILELLWESDRPMGAYELVEALKPKEARPVGPPTVYRALEFLMLQGLVSKLQSRNAYVPCTHPERTHDCLFFICSNCSASIELEDPRLESLITENAGLVEFRPTRRVIEVEGTCSNCIAAGTAMGEVKVDP